MLLYSASERVGNVLRILDQVFGRIVFGPLFGLGAYPMFYILPSSG